MTPKQAPITVTSGDPPALRQRAAAGAGDARGAQGPQPAGKHTQHGTSTLEAQADILRVYNCLKFDTQVWATPMITLVA
jgi:hypothetical protein